MAGKTNDSASKISKVVIQTLAWCRTLYGKQKSEGQDDSFGSYQRSIRLVKVNELGEEVKEVIIQEDGKPVAGTVSTLHRQAIKLLVAAYFTAGSNKGSAYANTLALNLGKVEAPLKAMVKGNWHVDASYGSSPKSATPLYVSVKTLFSLAMGLVEIRTSTKAQYPDPVVADAPEAEAVEEEVSLSF